MFEANKTYKALLSITRNAKRHGVQDACTPHTKFLSIARLFSIFHNLILKRYLLESDAIGLLKSKQIEFLRGESRGPTVPGSESRGPPVPASNMFFNYRRPLAGAMNIIRLSYSLGFASQRERSNSSDAITGINIKRINEHYYDSSFWGFGNCCKCFDWIITALNMYIYVLADYVAGLWILLVICH